MLVGARRALPLQFKLKHLQIRKRKKYFFKREHPFL